MCVNRSLDCAIWPNYEVVEFQPKSVLDTFYDSVVYCYVILPRLTWYYSTRFSFHPNSSAKPGVAQIRPSIFSYYKMLTARPGISCIPIKILTTCSAYLPSYGLYCATIPSRFIWILASRKISSRIAQSCLSDARLRHHASLLQPPPSYPVFPAHYSNVVCKATHRATKCLFMSVTLFLCIILRIIEKNPP